MRFYTIEKNEAYFPVVSFDGGETAYALDDLGMDCVDLAQFIREGGIDKLEILKNAPREAAETIDLSAVKICAPIMYPDQDVLCLGINYDEHAKEAGKFSKEAFGGERPYTIYFAKRVNRATATGEPIPAYEDLVEGLDYEVELGVVLGRAAKGVAEEEATGYIFGYTIINDISARNLQTRHKQWYLGKSLDGFTPMGPCIVTIDELGDAENLAISCAVNGEMRQNSNTKYMIKKVAGAISEFSTGITLKAGTIIATGTPSGVGMGFTPPRFLKKGDVVTCSIEGIGELTNSVE